MTTLSDAQIQTICRLTHANNIALQECNDGEKPSPPWHEAPEWQRQDSEKSVRAILADPEMTAKSEHERWAAAKFADGWILGDVKDAEKKTHPCLISFELLPPIQRAKDTVRIATVRTLSTLYAETAPAQEAAA